MANKKTIQQINDELDELHRRLTRLVNRINELRDLRKRIRRGQVKQPPPKGVKVKFGRSDLMSLQLNDPLPSFGGTPAIE